MRVSVVNVQRFATLVNDRPSIYVLVKKMHSKIIIGKVAVER